MNNNKSESIGGCPSVGISDRLARTFVYIDGFLPKSYSSVK